MQLYTLLPQVVVAGLVLVLLLAAVVEAVGQAALYQDLLVL
jgi:hypothetical protein